MNKKLLSLLIIGLFFWGIVGTATATVIDNSVNEFSTGTFGVGVTNSAYYGQTFLGTASYLQILSFEVNTQYPQWGSDDVPFHILITETEYDSNYYVHPTNVLFESEKYTAVRGSNWTTFTINLNNTKIEDGKLYAWILDASITFDGISNGGSEIASNDDYLDGQMIWYDDFGYENAGRNFHFSQVWQDISSRDLAFTLSSSPVPEPTTMLLFGLGLLGLAGISREK